VAKCKNLERSLHTRLTKIATSLPDVALDKARTEWRIAAETIKIENRKWLENWADESKCANGCVKRPDYLLFESVEIIDEDETNSGKTGTVIGWIRSDITVFCLSPKHASAWKNAKMETYVETLTEAGDVPPKYECLKKEEYEK